MAAMVHSETIAVTGIRCERCVLRLGGALRRLAGLESATATLAGEVTIAWDDEQIARDEIVRALAEAGFRARSE